MTENQSSTGRIQLTTVSTLTECEAACLGQTTCTSFDFDPGAADDSRCWLLVSGSTDGVSHYRRIPCSQEVPEKQGQIQEGSLGKEPTTV